MDEVWDLLVAETNYYACLLGTPMHYQRSRLLSKISYTIYLLDLVHGKQSIEVLPFPI